MLLIIIVTAFIAYLLWISTRKPDKFPPGPTRWPLIGGLFYMKGTDNKLSLFHGARKGILEFGPIFGFHLGSTPVIMVSDLDLLRDLFKKEELSSRPPIRPLNELRVGWDVPELEGRAPGIVLSGGRYWRDQRRFVLRHLRDFGFGKSSMEGMLNTEVEKLVKMYQGKAVNKTFVINRSLNASIINALWSILVGDSFQLDDPHFIGIVTLLEKALQGTNPFSPAALALPHPSMAKWPLVNKISGYSNVKTMFNTLHEFIAPYIKEHQQSFQRDNARDLMDLIIQENENTTDEGSPFYGSKGVDALTNIFIELFLAGMGTTTSSLLWMFLYMLHHPEVQKKVHQELDKVVGRDRLPSLTDQDDLPYINAVIHESLRITSLAFNGLPHYATDEVEAAGYKIPKGSIIFGCLQHIMNDPNHFDEPRIFKPERFIDKKTGAFIPNDRVIPFSTGKRMCLGQSLAEKELYLFFTGIMQTFELTVPPGGVLPGYDMYMTNPQGIQRIPPEVSTVMKSRIN